MDYKYLSLFLFILNVILLALYLVSQKRENFGVGGGRSRGGLVGGGLGRTSMVGGGQIIAE